MIVDIPEGLPVPMVSSPPTAVPDWNSDDKNFLAMVFDMGSSLVHDNGVLLFFHKDDLKLRADIRGSAKAYHFKILKEWTGINRLPMTSCWLHTMLLSSVDAEVLHSTVGEELSRAAFFHLFHSAYG
jgi:hypothetical protein